MWVKAANPNVNVWDREQGDPKKGLTVPTDGTPVEVEATRVIMTAINDKRLVETKAPEKGASSGFTKLDPKDWPDREALKAMNLPELKAWAKAQELQFAGNMGEEALLNLIDSKRVQ